MKKSTNFTLILVVVVQIFCQQQYSAWQRWQQQNRLEKQRETLIAHLARHQALTTAGKQARATIAQLGNGPFVLREAVWDESRQIHNLELLNESGKVVKVQTSWFSPHHTGYKVWLRLEDAQSDHAADYISAELCPPTEWNEG